MLFIGDTDTATFAGQTVTGATTIAMYTYAGDVNLDGLVDAADSGVIDNWIQFPGTEGYMNGDFNYNGIIDAAGHGILDNSIQLQGAPFPGRDRGRHCVRQRSGIGRRDRRAGAGVPVGARRGRRDPARRTPTSAAQPTEHSLALDGPFSYPDGPPMLFWTVNTSSIAATHYIVG